MTWMSGHAVNKIRPPQHTCANSRPWICELHRPACIVQQFVVQVLYQLFMSPGCAMFAFIIMYGACLPLHWLDEEIMSITFIQGEFTICAFAEAIAPLVQCIAFALPVVPGTHVHTWTWTGHVTWRWCLSCQDQIQCKEVNVTLSDNRNNIINNVFLL